MVCAVLFRLFGTVGLFNKLQTHKKKPALPPSPGIHGACGRPLLVFILKTLKVVVVWYLRGRRGDANTARFSSFWECLFAPNLPQLRTGTPERPANGTNRPNIFRCYAPGDPAADFPTNIQYRSTAVFATKSRPFLNPCTISRWVLLFYESLSVCLSVCLSAEGMPTKRALHQPGLTVMCISLRSISKEQVFVRHKSLAASPRPPP